MLPEIVYVVEGRANVGVPEIKPVVVSNVIPSVPPWVMSGEILKLVIAVPEEVIEYGVIAVPTVNVSEGKLKAIFGEEIWRMVNLKFLVVEPALFVAVIA